MSRRAAIALWVLIYVLGNAVVILTSALVGGHNYFVGVAQGALSAVMWMLAWGFRWRPRPAQSPAREASAA